MSLSLSVVLITSLDLVAFFPLLPHGELLIVRSGFSLSVRGIVVTEGRMGASNVQIGLG